MIRLAACLAKHLPSLAEARPDGELLAAFLAHRDEAAFAELVRRHGPLVWSACRRLLPDPSDAEDAFQAAFLVLVRRAPRLTHRDAIGPWLYQVGVWTARNIRRRNARMLARRSPLSPSVADPAPGPTSFDLQSDIDSALLSLPEKYRTPLVLCHLQGWSRREAAARLGCPEGTLSSLLARGLDKLRIKLKGLDPTKALALGATTVPLTLANATIQAATGIQLATAFAIATTASQLAEGVLRMFWIKKATAASFAILAVFGMGIGIGVSVRQVPGAAGGDGPGTTTGVASAAADGVPGENLDQAIIREKIALFAIEEQMHSLYKFYVAISKLEKSDDPNAVEEARKELPLAREELEKRRQQLFLARARLLALQKQAEKAGPAKADDNLYEVIKLKNVSAEDAVKVIDETFNGPQKAQGGAKPNRVRVVADKPSNSIVVVTASPADLLAIRKLVADMIDRDKADAELEKLRKQLAAVEIVIVSAKAGVKLSQEKLKQSKEAQEQGNGSPASILQDQITLVRFEEHLAQAVQKRAKLFAEIDDEMEAKLKPVAEQHFYEVIKLKNADAVIVAYIIDRRVNGPNPGANRVNIVAEKRSNSLVIVNASPVDLIAIRKLLAELLNNDQLLLKQIIEDHRQLVEMNMMMYRQSLAAEKAAASRKGYLEITITSKDAKDASSPYVIREIGADGKSVGTVYFENLAILSRFLSRTAKDAAGPNEVQLAAPADVKYETVKAILDACKAAGFTPPTVLKIGNLKIEIELLPNTTATDLAAKIDRVLK